VLQYDATRSLAGGMGQVFLARQKKPRREVALKIMRADLAMKSASHRFRLEVEILGKLSHPGIAQIYEAGTTDDGRSYFTMEYVPGLILTDFVAKNRLSTNQVLELAVPICEAVQFAHKQGIIHRDLKPSNIIVEPLEEGSGRPKILDFGVAKATSMDHQLSTLYTLPGQLVGTLAYMSPEQTDGTGEDLDARADIYQIGVLLYELLAEKLPFATDRGGVAALVWQINNVEPKKLGSVDIQLRGDVERIVAKAMAKERDQRYSSAGELATDIRRYLAGEPVHARPATAGYRLGKALKKRRKSVIGGISFGLLVAVLMWTFLPDRSPIVTKAPVLTRLATPGEFPHSYSSLSYAPDGKKLAYSCDGRAWIRDMATGAAQDLSYATAPPEGRIVTASWDPTDEALFLEARVAADDFRLSRYSLNDQSVEPVFSYTEPAHPVLSPDGSRVLFELGNDHLLVTMELATGIMDTVLTVGDEATVSCPTWGPDSRHIAYIRIEEPEISLECVDLDGNQRVLLRNERLNFYAQRSTMAWLPDGRLVYSVFRDLSRSGVDLRAQEMDVKAGLTVGDPVHLCALEDRAALNLTYSSATKSLAFGGHRKARKLVLFDLRETPPLTYRELPTRGWPCLPIGWLPDGRSLVIEETNSSRDYETLVMDVESGELEPLLCCPEDSRPLGLLSGSEHLVVLDGDNLLAVPLDCGPPVDLGFQVEQGSFRVDVQRSTDEVGQAFLFVLDGTEIIIRPVSLQSGVGPVVKRLTFDFASIYAQRNTWAALAPDAKSVAVHELDANISLYGMDTGSVTVFPTDLGMIQELAWSRDGKRIYCQGAFSADYPRWMARFDPATEESEVLWYSDGSDGFEVIVRPVPGPTDEYLVSQILTLGVDFFTLDLTP